MKITQKEIMEGKAPTKPSSVTV